MRNELYQQAWLVTGFCFCPVAAVLMMCFDDCFALVAVVHNAGSAGKRAGLTALQEGMTFASQVAASISCASRSPLSLQSHSRLSRNHREKHGRGDGGRACRSQASMTKAESSMSLGPIGLLSSAGFLETAYLTYTKLVGID